MAKVATEVFTNMTDDESIPDLELCKKIYAELQRWYPGHQWSIEVNIEAGVGFIKLPYPDRNGRITNQGCLFHISKLDDKLVKQFGGELLERYKVARSGVTPEAKLMAINNGLDCG